MYIKGIRLVNFRNYEKQEIKFSSNGNLLFGYNAQGKSNILEAIYICALGKSYRFARDAEMIHFGKDGYFVEIELIKNDRSYKIEFGFDKVKGKRIKVGGVELKKIGELLGKLNVVMFGPDDLKMVKESPEHRRRFLDILICQLYSTYLYDLQQYYKILEQRNNLLKQIRLKPNIEETIDIWDLKLEEIGSKIIKKRYEFVEKISEQVKKIHYNLTSENEELEVRYKCCIREENLNNMEYSVIRERYKASLKQNMKIDIKRGFTGVGPHRDDLILTINKTDVEKYGSQGQQRTVVLSLKLSQLEIIKEEIDESPVLLLDDVFSELDENRRIFLMKYIEKMQVFITTTEDNEVFINKNNFKKFRVNKGIVKEE